MVHPWMNGIVNVEGDVPLESSIQDIPEWLRNIFTWYKANKVSEDELRNAIKYLVQQNIITLD